MNAGGDLQAALNSAQPGSTIVLQAGAVYTGSFVLPKKSGDGWITLQSSALAQLPGSGQRVSPADAAAMPRLVSPGLGEAAVTTAPGANHYRLVGLEVTKSDSSAYVYDLITLGDGSSQQDSLDKVPHDLVLDRCYIHGLPGNELKRGVALNSGATTISGCYIAEVKGAGYDTQAICGWNGPGPYEIVNNYLEAAGENIMFGGADPSITGLVPSDIQIVGNTLTKQLAWRGTSWSVKNLLELKIAQRVRIEGNLLENNWASAQNGYAVIFRSWNDGGQATWAVVQDVQFVNNIVRHSGSALNVARGDGAAGPDQPTQRVQIVNNLFDDINGATWGGDGNFLQIAGVDGVVVDHNTVLQSGMVTSAMGEPSNGFIFRNSIAQHNEYGVKGDSTGTGEGTLTTYFPNAVFTQNVLVGTDPSLQGLYPAGTYFPATLAAVGFVDAAGGNYRLTPSSPYHGQATDGSDIGCNFDQLQAAMTASLLLQRSGARKRPHGRSPL